MRAIARRAGVPRTRIADPARRGCSDHAHKHNSAEDETSHGVKEMRRGGLHATLRERAWVRSRGSSTRSTGCVDAARAGGREKEDGG